VSDEQQQWERRPGEPNLWYDRFVTYLRMGPSRSLLGAVHLEEAQKSPKKSSFSVPGAWKDAVERWGWKERAEAYDEYRRKQVFTQGNAYDVHRVERLNHYSERLEQELDKMFDALPKRMKKPWFNYFLFDKYLQTMDALAQETGGRVKKSEVTQKDIPTKLVGMDEDENGCEP
jgi:hypothetical protein